MIPLRLRLHNFMSYAELDLDLSGVHTAVLTGPNGAGKSSLLDAITYAIWDAARAKPEQLVRLGQGEMWVELLFAVEGVSYRVLRRRLTKKGAPAQLELHQAVPGGDYVSLTGVSVRETQARLLEIVRMDYETFTNSAFILQGRADQFTTKTPRERKALLGEILGLQRYDALAQAARDRHRAAQQRAADLEAEQAELRARVAMRPELEAQAAAARDGIASLALMLAQAEARRTRLEGEGAALRAAEAELARATGDRAAARAEVARLEGELAARNATIAAAARRVEARAAIEAAYSDWQGLQAEEAAARKRADAWLAAERAIAAAAAERQRGLHALELTIAAARQAREALVREDGALVAAAGGRAPVERELAELRSELAALAAAAEEQERVQEQGLTERGKLEQARAAEAHAREAIQAVDAKLAQLEVTLEIHGAAGYEAGRPEGPSGPPAELVVHRASACPLCETPLSAADLAKIQSQYARERAEHEEKLARLGRTIARLEQAIEGSRARYRELGQRLKAGEALRRREGELAAKLAGFEAGEGRRAAIAAELPTIEAKIAALEAERDAAAAAHDATIAGLRAEQAASGHDEAAHAALRARLDALADAPERWAQLQQDLLGLEGAHTQAARLEAERAGAALAAAEAGRAAEEAERKLARRDDHMREAAANEAELKRLRDEERGRHAEIGRLEAELARLTEDEQKLAAREHEWRAAIDDVQAYKELSQAFGKEGIQALIIENALPELEEEANRLLARLSDNRMHVRLATQREKKTGGVAETLEIHISDEVGTRSYELYSGGEAFRVNFALRLALSRLLARRAGARLQTMVIDEGFGTQDDRGRERLVEAINAVSDEFQRILVITHIRELKDAFNTQIEVSKRGGVSEVRLSA